MPETAEVIQTVRFDGPPGISFSYQGFYSGEEYHKVLFVTEDEHGTRSACDLILKKSSLVRLQETLNSYLALR